MIPVYNRRFFIYDTDCHFRDELEYDEGCLKVSNTLDTVIYLQTVPKECHMCNMGNWTEVEPNYFRELAVFSEYSTVFGFVSEKGDSCKVTYTFKQHGEYHWSADLNCQPVTVAKAPDIEYLPIVVYFILFLMFNMMYFLWKMARHRKIIDRLYYKVSGRMKNPDSSRSEASEATTTATTQTSGSSGFLPVPQVISIHVFRGITIGLMILCYSESAKYWFMKQSPWNGISIPDFTFPWFLWTMGALLYLKYRTALLMGTSRLNVVWDMFWRSVRYILFGLFLNSFQQNLLSNLRIPGELQRYGILHFVCFCLEVLPNMKEIEPSQTMYSCVFFLDCWVHALFTVCCLITNMLVTHFLPIPDCPTGYTGPGGHHMYDRYMNCTGGAARSIDVALFGADHLKEYPNCWQVYACKVNFDPDGVLGTLNCVLTVFSGIQASKIIVYFAQVKHQITHLLIYGVIQTGLGLGLCGFSTEEGLIPLNRSLWSPSFALLTSGTAFFMFTLLYVIVDIQKWWSGTPCFQLGLNAMMIYIGHQLTRFTFPFSWRAINITTYYEYNLMDIISLSIWTGIAMFAYKHNKIVLI